MLKDNTRRALEVAMRHAPPGDWAEFGVSAGHSARFLLERLPAGARLWLFDSFAGLPEPWNGRDVGAYACAPPSFDHPACRVVPGLFDETLGPWAESFERRLGLVHVDCDLYSSTRTVLRAVDGLLADDAIVVFDEAHGYPGWEEHEAKAFHEWLVETGRRAHLLASDTFQEVFRLGPARARTRG
jgi:hypothetical protein